MLGFGKKEPERDPLIGKCYAYRQSISDPDETYFKILVKEKKFFSNYSGIEIKSFGMFGIKDQPSIEYEGVDNEKLKLFREITLEEFDLKTKPMLEKLGLQKINNNEVKQQ